MGKIEKEISQQPQKYFWIILTKQIKTCMCKNFKSLKKEVK